MSKEQFNNNRLASQRVLDYLHDLPKRLSAITADYVAKQEHENMHYNVGDHIVICISSDHQISGFEQFTVTEKNDDTFHHYITYEITHADLAHGLSGRQKDYTAIPVYVQTRQLGFQQVHSMLHGWLVGENYHYALDESILNDIYQFDMPSALNTVRRLAQAYGLDALFINNTRRALFDIRRRILTTHKP